MTTANTVNTTLAAGDFTPGGGTILNNYTLPVIANGAGHVTPKALAITADSKSFLFGSPVPPLTASFDAFASGENVGNLTGSLIFTIKNAANTVVPYNAGTPAGTYTITPSGVMSSNYAITFNNGTLNIGAWTLNGFYQPVGVQNTYGLLVPPMAGIVWNSIKGGQTVPLKFNIFAGSVEQTNTSAVFGFSVGEVSCTVVGTSEDPVDFVTTGATELRYTGTPGVDGQFIQNWQTPKTANKCYRTVMTSLDGSVLVSFFKTKK